MINRRTLLMNMGLAAGLLPAVCANAAPLQGIVHDVKAFKQTKDWSC